MVDSSILGSNRYLGAHPAPEYISSRINADRPRLKSSSLTPEPLLNGLWELVDKSDRESDMMQISQDIAQLRIDVEPRFLHMAVQNKMNKNAPISEWAEGPNDAVAFDAFRMLLNRMMDLEEAKSKLQAVQHSVVQTTRLADAARICSNVDKSMYFEGKRKLAQDGEQPPAKRYGFNSLEVTDDPKNVSCSRCNASNHVLQRV